MYWPGAAADERRCEAAGAVRGDGGDQALELGRIECLDLPLHRAVRVEPVAAGERRPAGIARLPWAIGAARAAGDRDGQGASAG
ncbi:hypothetical protein [Streptomyces mutabilis]|uniref:Uncharacterized protein n=1 Tax=Streptomyces mutabilis TaxID=67332 RepID=A0A086MQI5_9ACTN|nr:hypothetical protein [Streptomyces mutabilis]KFG71153.1 hypothetical protein FM21_36465 [Streptomyces mutabilis]